MSRRTFGDNRLSQRERCLEIAARIKRETDKDVTPGLVTQACFEEGVFTQPQLDSFQFQAARRMVEQWMKTPDGDGLPTWGQLPLPAAGGEMVWEQRVRMKIGGYAWNYLLRDDVVASNQITRDRWRAEALRRWSAREFDAEVERLREEREQGSGAA